MLLQGIDIRGKRRLIHGIHSPIETSGGFRLCNQSSLSGMVWAVLITQTPGSLLSTTTVRPANSLPKEIWPLAPTCFTTCLAVFMLH